MDELQENEQCVPKAEKECCDEFNLNITIKRLEEEKCRMQTEFNLQRAKLKDLFIQKEAEHARCQSELLETRRQLDEIRSQFVIADLKSENELHLKDMKAQEEISSLQQLVQETIEESINFKAVLDSIKEENKRLILDNKELRNAQQQQKEIPNLAKTQMLSQVTKTLVRKLGVDSSTSSLVGSLQQESVDEEMRSKCNLKQYIHEDAEVLRSLVEQLQEEMEALKEKLRKADEQLQSSKTVLAINVESKKSDYLDTDNSVNKSTSTDVSDQVCTTCKKLESVISDLLTKAKSEDEKLTIVQKNFSEVCEDLKKEASLRKDLEDQWQEKREAHKIEVRLLREEVKSNEGQLLDLQQRFLETKEEITRQLQHLTDNRERVNKHLEILQEDNNFLSGRYLASAEEIENQYINLPNTVEELQEFILQQQNELILARVGSEFEKQKCVSSLDEIQILRDQLDASNNERNAYKKKAQSEIKSLQDRVTEHLLILQNYERKRILLERNEADLNRRISELRVQNIELQDKNEKLLRSSSEYKAKIKILQDDLATSEQVQKDFVKLSQNLQISLERLRLADTEVRWQDDDDVDQCPTCNINFTVMVRKVHCRHCGQILCENCITKIVLSGPRKKPARVCDICHTLLTPNTAPYFSHDALGSL